MEGIVDVKSLYVRKKEKERMRERNRVYRKDRDIWRKEEGKSMLSYYIKIIHKVV